MDNRDFGSAAAVVGLDFVRDENGVVCRKGYNGWKQYADREAKRKCRNDHFSWFPVVCYVTDRQAYRISFGAQPETA